MRFNWPSPFVNQWRMLCLACLGIPNPNCICPCGSHEEAPVLAELGAVDAGASAPELEQFWTVASAATTGFAPAHFRKRSRHVTGEPTSGQSGRTSVGGKTASCNGWGSIVATAADCSVAGAAEGISLPSCALSTAEQLEHGSV